ncbi:aminoglycoside phosphotransferase family protein [Nannocystis punicea]|uniref:APH(6) family putative aminoglycoside O-phosphotransferase n=1 Tax=Nannocystis punicea TaxID=2995304 RepID=A0ABY7HEU7_9BACT|nr:aminoglycoside phosphotransferase family protein [Nannocystis poenicansa]WAS97807.1 APH(6) family putative aminoglycoside O-phosphotransferase [Nannocystis poenicansa]
MTATDAPWSWDAYLARWGLVADGAEIVTHAARLLPVKRGDEPAMLKVATEPDERHGHLLLRWWDGEGAARLYEAEGAALLLERATGTRSLAELARTGGDEEATIVLCDALAALHRPRATPIPAGLVDLPTWFSALGPGARRHGGLLREALAAASRLLADLREVRPLHGDLHHDNLLDFGARGWLAIDPKHLLGDPGFDYANIFSNPDMAGGPPVAVHERVFHRRLELVTQRSGIARARLLEWILAWSGLSAAWILDDGDEATIDLRIAELAARASSE